MHGSGEKAPPAAVAGADRARSAGAMRFRDLDGMARSSVRVAGAPPRQGDLLPLARAAGERLGAEGRAQLAEARFR